MTADEVIDRASRLISDPRNKRHTRTVMLAELNKIICDISSETECFKKAAAIQIQDQRRVYEFPEDMLRPVQMTIETIVGELIFSTTYASTVHSGGSNGRNNSQADQFHAFGQRDRRLNRISRIFFRELVSEHQFILDPVLQAESVSPEEDNPTILFGS